MNRIGLHLPIDYQTAGQLGHYSPIPAGPPHLSLTPRPESTIRAAIYARVSTTDQTCEIQLTALREYVDRRGWENAGEYVDSGWSGAKASRPEFDRVITEAGRRRFDAVLCWKLDRFGRSILNCLMSIQELPAPRGSLHRQQPEH